MQGKGLLAELLDLKNKFFILNYFFIKNKYYLKKY